MYINQTRHESLSHAVDFGNLNVLGGSGHSLTIFAMTLSCTKTCMRSLERVSDLPLKMRALIKRIINRAGLASSGARYRL